MFDEFYNDLYRIDEATRRMEQCDRIIFMGTSFSVNITNMALDIAMQNLIEVEVVDPEPVAVRAVRAAKEQVRQCHRD